MVFLENTQVIPLKAHNYDDGFDFGFRSARVFLEDVRLYPASRNIRFVHTIHQEFRVDEGGFLGSVPTASFTASSTSMTKFSDTGVVSYVPGKNAALTFECSADGMGLSSMFDTTNSMWVITRNIPAASTTYTDFTIRPYAIIAIGEATNISPTVTPGRWVQHYKRSTYPSLEEENWDISSSLVKTLKTGISMAGLYWTVLAVKSPLGYSNAYRIMGSTEKLTMPAISFTGTPTADTSFAILEYGCDLVNWKITTAT